MSAVDDVRAAADIVKIVGDYVKLRKSGVNFTGLCPFHKEKTPSLAVHPGKQIFHCFGCGVGGDVFKFVMLIENVSFSEALRRLAEKTGVALGRWGEGETGDADARRRAVLYRVHEVAARFFIARLGATAEGRAARAYLADRGLSDAVIAQFGLGYAPSDGQVLVRHLTEAGFEPVDIDASGLVVKDGTSERRFARFRRRVIFPIARETGKIVAFGARTLGEEQPKYLNSPETPIYTKSRTLYNLDRAGNYIRRADFAVLVEGYMDVIAVTSAGIENVVASCGTSLTESQVRLLARYSRRIVVNYDPDTAGAAGVERSLGLLLEEGFQCRVLELKGGLDPDAFIRQLGAAVYRERLDAAPSYLDYLTEQAARAHDLQTAEGRVAAANAVMPHVARVPNPLLRAEYAARLAERLRIDERLLRAELTRAASEGQKQVKGRPEVAAALEASPAEKELLRAFLSSRALADEFLPRLAGEGCLEGLPSEAIFRELQAAFERGENMEPSSLEVGLKLEERRLLYECQFAAGDPPNRGRTYAAYLAVKRRHSERQRERLQAAIQAAERAGDLVRIAQLLRDKSNLDNELAQLRRSQKNVVQLTDFPV